MAQVNVSVNGRSYKMGCRVGEEERIVQLAAEVEALVQQIKGSAKIVPDDRLFLMAAIMLADQLWDARDDLQRSLKQIADARAYQVIEGGTYSGPRDLQRQAELAMSKLETLPQRVG